MGEEDDGEHQAEELPQGGHYGACQRAEVGDGLEYEALAGGTGGGEEEHLVST